MTCDEAIKGIRKALNNRSRQIWSVTGGRVTAYRWRRAYPRKGEVITNSTILVNLLKLGPFTVSNPSPPRPTRPERIQ